MSKPVVELLEQLAQPAHLAGAEPGRPRTLDLGYHLPRDRIDLAPSGGCPDQLRAAVAGIGNALDVVVALQMGHELGHGLLGDLGPSRELAHRRALVVEKREDVAVRWADVGMPALADSLVQLLGGDSIRLA